MTIQKQQQQQQSTLEKRKLLKITQDDERITINVVSPPKSGNNNTYNSYHFPNNNNFNATNPPSSNILANKIKMSLSSLSTDTLNNKSSSATSASEEVCPTQAAVAATGASKSVFTACFSSYFSSCLSKAKSKQLAASGGDSYQPIKCQNSQAREKDLAESAESGIKSVKKAATKGRPVDMGVNTDITIGSSIYRPDREFSEARSKLTQSSELEDDLNELVKSARGNHGRHVGSRKNSKFRDVPPGDTKVPFVETPKSESIASDHHIKMSSNNTTHTPAIALLHGSHSRFVPSSNPVTLSQISHLVRPIFKISNF
jgi:hypothetical protein